MFLRRRTVELEQHFLRVPGLFCWVLQLIRRTFRAVRSSASITSSLPESLQYVDRTWPFEINKNSAKRRGTAPFEILLSGSDKHLFLCYEVSQHSRCNVSCLRKTFQMQCVNFGEVLDNAVCRNMQRIGDLRVSHLLCFAAERICSLTTDHENLAHISKS